MKVARILVAVTAALGTTVAVSGQSLNINFGSTATLTPSSTYGAGAGQAGVWNMVTLPTATNQALVGLGGGATGVTISLDGGSMFNFTNSAPNGTTTPPGSDAERLLDSLWDPGAGNPAGTITISGLVAGLYDIYTYGVAPDGAADRTTITIGGNQQTVQGQLPNPFNEGYALGLTHALHTVNHAGGNIAIDIGVGPGGFASVNGIQIVLIPAPGALAVLGFAGLIGPRRRRS